MERKLIMASFSALVYEVSIRQVEENRQRLRVAHGFRSRLFTAGRARCVNLSRDLEGERPCSRPSARQDHEVFAEKPGSEPITEASLRKSSPNTHRI
jgi:hypothetical protein